MTEKSTDGWKAQQKPTEKPTIAPPVVKVPADVRRNQQINTECQECPIARTHCRLLWRNTKKKKDRKPVFITAIVALAVKHGGEMVCLRGKP
ncbi:MAG: hypothetical protein Q7V05_11425 [Methanoregula sp.]|nr:hypothetical protein [Methanoregula sp.]